MNKLVGSWTENLDQELDVLTKKGLARTDEEHARFGLLHGFKSEFKKQGKLHTPWKEDEMSSYQWTRIDPAIHTADWFRGKAATFVLESGGRWTSYGIDPVDLYKVSRFFIHPPLPDPLEEEIEREARKYSVSQIAQQDFIAGYRACLRRGK
jgi:hypothetical protein